jgi:hypothetical protein
MCATAHGVARRKVSNRQGQLRSGIHESELISCNSKLTDVALRAGDGSAAAIVKSDPSATVSSAFVVSNSLYILGNCAGENHTATIKKHRPYTEAQATWTTQNGPKTSPTPNVEPSANFSHAFRRKRPHSDQGVCAEV